jgi:hypothetical protein
MRVNWDHSSLDISLLISSGECEHRRQYMQWASARRRSSWMYGISSPMLTRKDAVPSNPAKHASNSSIFFGWYAHVPTMANLFLMMIAAVWIMVLVHFPVLKKHFHQI